MSFGSILLLSLGLAMDATAVAAARGIAVPYIRRKHVLSVALFFGGFQALMPLIGWMLGVELGPFVAAWDHWIAFLLLGAIGGKMLWEARKSGDEDSVPHPPSDQVFGFRVMLLLAIATSIDALAVGITLPLLNAPLLLSVVTIGVTTAVLSVLGLFAGRHFGTRLGKRLDIVGGVLLIGMGAKILIEHCAD
jgi:putative Mn2+ efflux pump MntP